MAIVPAWVRTPQDPKEFCTKIYIFEISLLHHYYVIITSLLRIITSLLGHYYIVGLVGVRTQAGTIAILESYHSATPVFADFVMLTV